MLLACGPALACERESGPAETDWAGTGFAWAERGRERVGRGERERAGPPEVGPGRSGLGLLGWAGVLGLAGFWVLPFFFHF